MYIDIIAVMVGLFIGWLLLTGFTRLESDSNRKWLHEGIDDESLHVRNCFCSCLPKVDAEIRVMYHNPLVISEETK